MVTAIYNEEETTCQYCHCTVRQGQGYSYTDCSGVAKVYHMLCAHTVKENEQAKEVFAVVATSTINSNLITNQCYNVYYTENGRVVPVLFNGCKATGNAHVVLQTVRRYILNGYTLRNGYARELDIIRSHYEGSK